MIVGMQKAGAAPHGEYSAVPVCIIVHDPVQAGAFKAMCRERPERIEASFLYREIPDPSVYAQQHRAMVSLLQQQVQRIIYLHELIDPVHADLIRANPNHVFCRDSLITIPWIPEGYITACMKPLLRRHEPDIMAAAVQRLGLHEIVRLSPDMYLEGGDVIPFVYDGKRVLLIGYGPRTSEAALYCLQRTLIPELVDEIIGIHLAPWRMNLDGGFLPVADDVVIADTSSILDAILLDASGANPCNLWQMLADLGVRIIDTTREESIYMQSCNCICLGKRKVICYDLCQRVIRLLQRYEIETCLVAGNELVKGRGGPRCMTRPVYL